MAKSGEDLSASDGAFLNSHSDYFGGLPLAEKMDVAKALNVEMLAFLHWLASTGFWADDGLLGDPQCD